MTRISARDVLEALREIDNDPTRSHWLDGPLLINTDINLALVSVPIFANKDHLYATLEDYETVEYTADELAKFELGKAEVKRWWKEQKQEWDRLHPAEAVR